MRPPPARVYIGSEMHEKDDPWVQRIIRRMQYPDARGRLERRFDRGGAAAMPPVDGTRIDRWSRQNCSGAGKAQVASVKRPSRMTRWKWKWVGLRRR